LKIEGKVTTIVQRVRRWREAEICGDILDALGIGWDLGFARLGVDRSDLEAPTVTEEQVQAVLEILAAHRRAHPKPRHPRRMRESERDVVPRTLNAILAIAHIEHSGQHPRHATVARLYGNASHFTERVDGWRNSGVLEPILAVLGITWDFSLGGSQPRGNGSPSEADQATVDAPESERTQQAPVHDVQEGSATRDRPRPQAGAGTLQHGLQWGSGLARVLKTVAEADHPLSAEEVNNAVNMNISTVRSHLAALTKDGKVARLEAEYRGRGARAHRYRIAAAAESGPSGSGQRVRRGGGQPPRGRGVGRSRQQRRPAPHGAGPTALVADVMDVDGDAAVDDLVGGYGRYLPSARQLDSLAGRGLFPVPAHPNGDCFFEALMSTAPRRIAEAITAFVADAAVRPEHREGLRAVTEEELADPTSATVALVRRAAARMFRHDYELHGEEYVALWAVDAAEVGSTAADPEGFAAVIAASGSWLTGYGDRWQPVAARLFRLNLRVINPEGAISRLDTPGALDEGFVVRVDYPALHYLGTRAVGAPVAAGPSAPVTERAGWRAAPAGGADRELLIWHEQLDALIAYTTRVAPDPSGEVRRMLDAAADYLRQRLARHHRWEGSRR